MARKTFVGKVISNKMTKTAVVAVEIPKRDPFYGKSIRNTAKFKVHCDTPVAIGGKVKIEECRPLSGHKNWIIKEVIKT